MRRPSTLATMLCVAATGSSALAGCGSGDASDQAAASTPLPVVAATTAPPTTAATSPSDDDGAAASTQAPAATPAAASPIPTFSSKPAATPEPATADRGPIEIRAVLMRVDPAANELLANVSLTVAGDDPNASAAVRRGIALVSGASSAPVAVQIADATKITIQRGSHALPTHLRDIAAAASGAPLPTRLIWKLDGHQPRTLRALLAHPPAQVLVGQPTP